MDFVVMAAVLGLLSSGQACAPFDSSTQAGPGSNMQRSNGHAQPDADQAAEGTESGSAWDAWLHKLLDGERTGAALEKGNMWGFAVAQVMRNAASELSGASADRLSPQFADTASARAMLEALTSYVCEAASQWQGLTLQSAKTIGMLHASIEAMLKVCNVLLAQCQRCQSLQHSPARLVPSYCGLVCGDSQCCWRA